jgi:hypothetical protein
LYWKQKFEVKKLIDEEKGQFFIHYKPEAGFVKNLSDLLKYFGENIVIVPDKQNFSAVIIYNTKLYFSNHNIRISSYKTSWIDKSNHKHASLY